MENTLENRLYYNEAGLMVYYKMPGEICSTWEECAKDDTKNYLLQHLLLEYSGLKFCECCYNLEPSVSGLIVISRKPQLVRPIQKALMAKDASKTYYAIVEGVVPEFETFKLMENQYMYSERKQKAFVLGNRDLPGKTARLLWRCNGSVDTYSFIEIQLLTDLKDQIRCQFSSAGMPILGDNKYGSSHTTLNIGIRLYSGKLDFTHPVTNKKLSFVSPPPIMDGLWTAEWISSGMRTTSPAEGLDG